MKYMANGGIGSNSLIRLTLGLTLTVLLGLWVTNAVLYLTRMGLDPQSVVRHYRGSEEEYVQARTLGSMLEVTHAHLATMAVVVLLLTHLAIFLPWSMRARVVLIVTPFAGLVLGEAAGWLVRFAHPGFAVMKVAAFLAFQISLLALIFAVAVLILRPRPVQNQNARMP